MRRLLAKLGICEWVWLIDHDGDHHLRLKRRGVSGQPWAVRMGGVRKVILNDDGTCGGGVYCVNWKPF